MLIFPDSIFSHEQWPLPLCSQYHSMMAVVVGSAMMSSRFVMDTSMLTSQTHVPVVHVSTSARHADGSTVVVNGEPDVGPPQVQDSPKAVGALNMATIPVQSGRTQTLPNILLSSVLFLCTRRDQRGQKKDKEGLLEPFGK